MLDNFTIKVDTSIHAGPPAQKEFTINITYTPSPFDLIEANCNIDILPYFLDNSDAFKIYRTFYTMMSGMEAFRSINVGSIWYSFQNHKHTVRV